MKAKYRSYVAHYWRAPTAKSQFLAGGITLGGSSHWLRESDAKSYLETVIEINGGPTECQGKVVESNQPAEIVVHCGEHPQAINGRCFGCGIIITPAIARKLSRVKRTPKTKQ